ncbi:large subunit ribosomal protein L7A [Caldanaerobius fijiensis DSM 17918]|uniref:Large subunit ribosomal protein L7A n=1 Tax=Caldanaerobius fijiensis DSM 17918 TaxID=1121256 RepID=A0A1M5EUI5_9THEO|nr:ribosomal L7Ae/L30e/S12e/Gadd45 family protein [Caldanaerobius fijiensis]SHF82796.1 large subunit ribosomal protein L7A [Caldanaerobius fijiensis DSM 17918]
MSDQPLRLLKNAKLAIGAKQTRKAIEAGLAKEVYIARDAENHVVDKIIELCKEKDINILYIDTMKELGELCGIDVGAASIAVLK